MIILWLYLAFSYGWVGRAAFETWEEDDKIESAWFIIFAPIMFLIAAYEYAKDEIQYRKLNQ
jgi:membrane protein DedA with SNARE-associated domain